MKIMTNMINKTSKMVIGTVCYYCTVRIVIVVVFVVVVLMVVAVAAVDVAIPLTVSIVSTTFITTCQYSSLQFCVEHS